MLYVQIFFMQNLSFIQKQKDNLCITNFDIDQSTKGNIIHGKQYF